jgi:hypothetical protein
MTFSTASRHKNHKPLLFWGMDAGKRPQDFVRTDVPEESRQRLAVILSKGRILASYRGMASCRVCKQMLGSCDMGAHGFVWPQEAQHYVLQHGVWTPECDELLHCVDKEYQKANANQTQPGLSKSMKERT